MDNFQGPSVGTRIKSFFIQCTRVWQLLRKPSMEEFKSISKISALGLLAIGLIGFLIADIMKFLNR
ncbi:protein translocase SEC61 complex subunit gamma [Candidatus Pacearchaeota archaeon]|nr:protein translocase SEC61 complex subunit gamma [Candidatus Pacearchaeota archaeon]